MSKKDFSQLAKYIVDVATGQIDKPVSNKDKKKSEAGRKGGKKRASKLTASQRESIAKKAAQTRWKKPTK